MKALIVGAVAIVVIARGQEPAEPVTFRAGVANVRVDAQVFEGTRAVAGLTQTDFLLYDNNVAQTVTYFDQEREPVTLLLVLDVSGSMSRHLEQMAAASRTALKGLRAGDHVGVMVFARNSRVTTPFTTDFARITDDLKTAIRERDLGSGTQINAALHDAAKVFADQAPATGRRAILIVTDNLGVNYQLSDQTVIRALHDSNTVCNTIVVGRSKKSEKDSRFRNPDFSYANVFGIAEETGGDAIKSDKTGEAFGEILERIRSRYSLHYGSPGGEPGAFRQIRLELTAAAKTRFPVASLRYRKGYYVR
ncbi:MAG: VWA domain-containing protein [Bryobacteraceae bacterium]